MRALVAAAGITFVATAATFALAAPPTGPQPGGPHPGGSGHPGRLEHPGRDEHPGREGRGELGEHPGGPPPFGSAFPAPSGSVGRFGHGWGHGEHADGGAPRPRGERAAEHRHQLRERFQHMFHGAKAPNGLADEMKLHAHRVARLERARSVAEEAKDNEAVARADALLTKENQRHERWLAKQQQQAPGVASAVAPAGSAP